MNDSSAGQALREWRGERTQAWLAKQLGVVQTTVSRLETGDLAPTRAMAMAIEHLTEGRVTVAMWPVSEESGPQSIVDADRTG